MTSRPNAKSVAEQRKEKVLEILGSDFVQLGKKEDGDASNSTQEFQSSINGNSTQEPIENSTNASAPTNVSVSANATSANASATPTNTT